MSDGREKPDIPINPGSVVEGAKKAIHGPDPDDKFTELVEEFRRKLLHIPDENFADGVRAEKTFREDVCPNGRSPLGPYIPTHQPHRGDTREVGGVGQYYLFPDFMGAWFDEQTPDTLSAMTVLSRKQIRKTIFNQIIKENWIRASLVFSFVVGCVQYGAQVVEWVLKNLPAIRSAWQLLRAGAGQ